MGLTTKRLNCLIYCLLLLLLTLNLLFAQGNNHQTDVVSLDKFSETDSIVFYNKDGSIWHHFSFDYNGRFENRDDFKPLAFHPDYFLLVLIPIAKEGDKLGVLVNDETVKYIDANSDIFHYQSWEEHLLEKVYAIDLNKNQQLRRKPSADAEIVDKDAQGVYQPVQVLNDWLKVRWQSEKSAKQTKQGWIRWKDGDRILLKFLYIS